MHTDQLNTESVRWWLWRRPKPAIQKATAKCGMEIVAHLNHDKSVQFVTTHMSYHDKTPREVRLAASTHALRMLHKTICVGHGSHANTQYHQITA